MGPLIDKADVARVDGMVEAALAYAKPIVRGGPATDGALAAGAFYRPALLEVEDVNTEIVQKEVFGPVATFEVFDTETDAIARANASEWAWPPASSPQHQHQPPGEPRDPGRHRLDEHLGRDQRRIRRGWLQAKRRRSPRGPLAITEFQEAKTVVHAIPPLARLTRSVTTRAANRNRK